MAFFNGSIAAQNIQVGLDNPNLITTKQGALRLQSEDSKNGQGQIEIGESSANVPQMTITKDGVVIESNLIVKGQKSAMTTETLLVKDINIELGYGVYPIYESSSDVTTANYSKLNNRSIKLENGSNLTITNGVSDVSSIVFFDNEVSTDQYVSYATDSVAFLDANPGYNPGTQMTQSNDYTSNNWMAVLALDSGTYKWGAIRNVQNLSGQELDNDGVNDGGITLKSSGSGGDKTILYDNDTTSWKLSENVGAMKNKRFMSIDNSEAVNGNHIAPGKGRSFISQNASNNITTFTGRVTDITNHSITELISYKTKVLYVDNGRTDNYGVSTQAGNSDIHKLPYGSSVSESTVRNGTEIRPYKTITQAISALSSNKYKYVIIVKNGVYTEATLNVSGKDVTIQGESKEGVIVQRYSNPLGLTIGSGTPTKQSSNVFTINASGKSVVLKDMTIRNGNWGVYSSAGNVSVENCNIYRNGYDGQAVGSHVNSLATAQTFRNNHMHSTQSGGGVYIASSYGTAVKHCNIYENALGVDLRSCSSCDVENNNVHNNMKGGVLLSAPSGGSGQTGCNNCLVDNNVIDNNFGYGVMSQSGLGNKIYENNVFNNWNAGCVSESCVEETIEDNVFRKNNQRSYSGNGSSQSNALGSVVLTGSKTTSGGSFAVQVLRNKIMDTQVGYNSSSANRGVVMTSSLNGRYNNNNNKFTVSDNTMTGHDTLDNTTGSDIVNLSSYGLSEFGNLLSTNSVVYNGVQARSVALGIQNITDNNSNITLDDSITMIKRTVTGTQEITIPAGPSATSGVHKQGIQKSIFFDNTAVPGSQRPGAITIVNFTYTEGGVVKKGLTNGEIGASKLKFNASGQGVTLMFVDTSWKIINSGALIIP